MGRRWLGTASLEGQQSGQIAFCVPFYWIFLAREKVCKTFIRRFDSDPRLQVKHRPDWPSGYSPPQILSTPKTAQNGEDKPKPWAVRGQSGGQQRGQTPLLLVYESPQQYQQVTDSAFHLSNLKRWFDLNLIQNPIQKANSRRCA